MPRRTTAFDLALPPAAAGVPARLWLYGALRAEILAGRLVPGARLPSTRDLARQYALSRGTIVHAFEQLKSEGYVEGTLGAGTCVSRVLPERMLHADPPARTAHPPASVPELSRYARRARLYCGYEKRPVRPFRPNLPALDLFPAALWARLAARCLRRISIRGLISCDVLGFLPLRQAVAEYLSHSRGVRCAPEQIAIVPGMQGALDLAARILLDPGDRVALENPGYSAAALAFEAAGARISPVPVDGEGLMVRRLPARGVRLVYVTPGHQFPLGATMSLARRLELLEWARNSGAIIFEDDYDSEFRYSGRPVPALQGLDESGQVLYAGSFSKVLFPSLRLGYVVVPPALLSAFETAQSLATQHAPLPTQMALHAFMAEGHFGSHLRRMRRIYAERLSVLLEESRSKLAGLLEIPPIEAGLQTAGWLQQGIEAEAAARVAAGCHVDVTPLGRYCRSGAMPQALHLGFAPFDARQIRRGVQQLAVALERCAMGST